MKFRTRDKAVPLAVEAPQTSRAASPRSALRILFELIGISALAIAQPIFDLLTKNLSLLLQHDAGAIEIIALALGILLVPPLVAFLCVRLAAVAVGRRTAAVTRALWIGAFAGLAIEEGAKTASTWGRGPIIGAGLLGGLVGAVVAYRSTHFATVLRYLSAASVGFLVMFLAFSPVTDVAFGRDDLGAAGAAIGRPKRVVFIVLDELPTESLLDGSGRVDAEMFPNIAAFSGTSTWYRNETVVHPFTEWAVPAILTGKYPRSISQHPTASAYPNSLFRLLGGAYSLNVHESVTKLCAPSLCQRQQRRSDPIRRVRSLGTATFDLWKRFASPTRETVAPFEPLPDIPEQVPFGLSFIESLKPNKHPVLDFVHLLMPHQPFRYLPTLQDAGYSRDDPFLKANLLTWGTEWAARVGRERHLLQLQAADRLFGDIVARLRSIHAFDDSVIVLSADHGMGFGNQVEMRAISQRNADQLLFAPLMIKDANQSVAVVDDRPMQTIDIVPTVAALLQVNVPWKVDGVAATGPARPEFTRRFYQWKGGALMARTVPVASNGKYLSFDTKPLFAKVLAASAAPRLADGTDPSLRPYAIGPYWKLIGEDPTPFVDINAPSPTLMSVLDRDKLDNVDPRSQQVPWTWLEGFVNGARTEQVLAFSINGHLAGFGAIDKFGENGGGFYVAALTPKFFVSGPNDLKVFAVSGSPSAPRLKQVAVGI